MPEAPIDKHHDALIAESEVGLARQRQVPTPTPYAVSSQQICQSGFSDSVACRLNRSHNLRTLLLREHVGHFSGLIIVEDFDFPNIVTDQNLHPFHREEDGLIKYLGDLVNERALLSTAALYTASLMIQTHKGTSTFQLVPPSERAPAEFRQSTRHIPTLTGLLNPSYISVSE